MKRLATLKKGLFGFPKWKIVKYLVYIVKILDPDDSIRVTKNHILLQSIPLKPHTTASTASSIVSETFTYLLQNFLFGCRVVTPLKHRQKTYLNS